MPHINANMALIGLGPHAKRIYMNCFKKNGFEPELIVDVRSKKEEVMEYIHQHNLLAQTYFIEDKNQYNEKLNKKDENNLFTLIRTLDITHCVISTEPKAHKAYICFCMEHNIHCLVDKPLTSPVDACWNYAQAKKIEDDYDEIVELYQKAKEHGTILKVQCQRRWHKGYRMAHDLAAELVKRYHIPITAMQVSHCDGMWNMPDEFVNRENHPYKYGYGKLFHSGYHFVDLVAWFQKINELLIEKAPDRVELYATSIKPMDFFHMINQEDYHSLLKTRKFDEIFENMEAYHFEQYGELDIYSILQFIQKDKVVSTVNMSLMQNGFSRRSWSALPEDTYKGNGRVRHEYMNIEIGPLADIQIHSYQSKEIKDRIENDTSVGEVEHFDIYVFRNVDLIGGKPFEKFTLQELYSNDEIMLGYNESAREKCFYEFAACQIQEESILDHDLGIRILSKQYEALCRQREGKKPCVTFQI